MFFFFFFWKTEAACAGVFQLRKPAPGTKIQLWTSKNTAEKLKPRFMKLFQRTLKSSWNNLHILFRREHYLDRIQVVSSSSFLSRVSETLPPSCFSSNSKRFSTYFIQHGINMYLFVHYSCYFFPILNSEQNRTESINRKTVRSSRGT